jgi:hypothetical protein
MTARTNRSKPKLLDRGDDSGAILVLVLLFLAAVGLVVGALLTATSTAETVTQGQTAAQVTIMQSMPASNMASRRSLPTMRIGVRPRDLPASS